MKKLVTMRGGCLWCYVYLHNPTKNKQVKLIKNQLKIILTCTVYRDKVTSEQAARWSYAGGRRVCGAGRIRENTGELLQPSPEMRYRR